MPRRPTAVVLRPEATRTTPLVLGAAVVLIAALGLAGPAGWERTAVEALVAVVTVVGLYLFVGTTGVLSFGHPTFLAVGAYTSTLLTLSPQRKSFTLPHLPELLAGAQVPWPVALLIGMVVAVALAALVAWPLARLDGIAAAIATLALLQIGHVVLINWRTVTNGQSAVVGIDLVTTLPVALGAAVTAIGLAWALQASRFGRRARATREDVRAAAALGIDVRAHRRWCLVASAAITAAAGSLYVHLVGVASADAFFLAAAFSAIAMLVLGGADSLSGAVLGGIGFVLIRQALRVVEGGIALGGVEVGGLQGLSAIGTAVLVLVVLALRPMGLTGGRELAVSSASTSTATPGKQVSTGVGTADPESKKGSMT